jgi:hypothetical protein
VSASADGSLMLQAVPLGGHILFGNPSAACFFIYVGEETTLLIRR